jgi:hypothetical protein
METGEIISVGDFAHFLVAFQKLAVFLAKLLFLLVNFVKEPRRSKLLNTVLLFN